MKKKIIAAACLAAVMAFTGCANSETPSNGSSTSSTSSTSSSTKTSKTEESSSEPESGKESSSKPEESSVPEADPNEADYNVTKTNDGSGVTITKYKGSDENVVIPETIGGETVVQISAGAFTDNIDITSVTIPASVTWLGANPYYEGGNGGNSFYGCANLKDVTFLGESLPSFIAEDFTGTPWLEAKKAENPDCLVVNNTLVRWWRDQSAITVPNGIKAVGYGAFIGMDKITSVTLPAGLTKVDGYAFCKCIGLKSVNIPDGVTEIGWSAFSECSALESISLPNSVSVIGGGAFDRCISLKSINIPSGITEIGDYTFCNCHVLESVSLPDGIAKIGKSAFSGCSALKSLNLPDSVTEVGEGVFSYSSLSVAYKGKTYNNDNFFTDFYEAVKQNAIEKKFEGKDFIITDNVLESVHPDAVKIELPDTLKGIADNAFDGCDKSIIIAFKGKNYNLANLDKLKEDVSGN